jgi:hypothetical protein
MDFIGQPSAITLAGVVAAFFVLGIVLGVVLVIALPAFDRRRVARTTRRDGGDHAGRNPPAWPGRRG